MPRKKKPKKMLGGGGLTYGGRPGVINPYGETDEQRELNMMAMNPALQRPGMIGMPGQPQLGPLPMSAQRIALQNRFLNPGQIAPRPTAGAEYGRNALLGAAIGSATGSPVGAAIGTGAGLLAAYLNRRKYAKGGVVKKEPVRLAAGGPGPPGGGASKSRHDRKGAESKPSKNAYAPPLSGEPIVPKKARGMGAALRGHNFLGSR